MSLKIYGLRRSGNVRRVLVVCEELAISYEFIDVDQDGGENKKPDYLKLHPFGQIPSMDDDGFRLYESRAICRYLVEKYGRPSAPKLMPAPGGSLQERMLFEQAACVELCNFQPFANGIYREYVAKARVGQQADQNIVTGLYKRFQHLLDGYERVLANQRYIAGDEFTVVDLFHLPYGEGIIGLGLGYDALLSEERPNVFRWWKEISNRPSWLAVKEKCGPAHGKLPYAK